MYDEEGYVVEAGYDALANAIIVQACKDYRKAIRHFDLFTMGQIRYFFHSQWFQMLTSIDGDRLIKDLERSELNGEKARRKQRLLHKQSIR